MKYLIDKIDSMGKQSVSAAAIVASNGDQAGKILIRFTDAMYGWNHEVSACIYGSDLNMRNSKKGGTYDKPTTLYQLFKSAGFKCFDHGDRRMGDYQDKTGHNVDSYSGFSDIAYVKNGNTKYTLCWVC